MPGDRLLSGGTTLPFEEVDGALELGVDPELMDATKTIAVSLTFDARGVEGGITARAEADCS
jgi:hypothetical protein